MQPLPIDEHLPGVVQALGTESRLIVQAPPGTGKSTRIPVALHKSLFLDSMVLIAEPRRIAARLLADRVASELGERTGETIGYRVRFEHVSTQRTRVCYATSGVLLRQVVTDPQLRGIGCLIIDEFHERHLDTDLLLALALHAQRTHRPDLRIVVMSATLDAERIRAVLGDCPVIRTEERAHAVEIEYAAADDDRPLEKQVASALRTLLHSGPPGDTLVFLPGAREIRTVAEHLAGAAQLSELEILALHGDMPLSKQAEVMQPSSRTKVILATNVAESSITVPGVVNVVDSGLARRAACSPWTGLLSLESHKISRAAATQRSGRAGRLAKGRALRLYSQRDYNSRQDYEIPEILRLDLCEALLLLRAAAIRSVEELSCVDQPGAPQIAAAEQLLTRLGALTELGELSETGRLMMQLPLHPRLARMVIEAQRTGVSEPGCLVAALLSEKDLRLDYRFESRGIGSRVKVHLGDSDVSELMDAFDLAAESGFSRSVCARERIDGPTARRVADVRRQLLGCLPRMARGTREPVDEAVALSKALLRGFPDRVAWCRQSGQTELTMTNGGTARLSENSVVRGARYMLAIDADERVYSGRKNSALVRVACRVDPNWLMDLDSALLQAEDRFYWAETTERVENQSTLRYGSIVLDESHSPATAGPDAAAVLVEVAVTRGILRADAITRLQEKMTLLVGNGLLPNELMPTDAAVRRALEVLCADRVNLVGVDAAAVADALANSLGPQTIQSLHRWAPDSYQLAGGRSVRVHYDPNCAAWIESRLQDFFGMELTPRIADGRQPLTLHLLAPNHRAVQVTQDLPGFWDRHYPSIRRELMRRYPKHKWPEDPRAAVTVPNTPTRAHRR
jgi:ATP-dependent helicase HrpB